MQREARKKNRIMHSNACITVVFSQFFPISHTYFARSFGSFWFHFRLLKREKKPQQQLLWLILGKYGALLYVDFFMFTTWYIYTYCLLPYDSLALTRINVRVFVTAKNDVSRSTVVCCQFHKMSAHFIR